MGLCKNMEVLSIAIEVLTDYWQIQLLEFCRVNLRVQNKRNKFGMSSHISGIEL